MTLWITKQLSPSNFTNKTAVQKQFLQRTFPKRIQSDIYEWQTFGEEILTDRRFGFHDYFSFDTLSNYATTTLNGFLVISGGFLNTEAGTDTQSGTSRIAHKSGFVINRPYTIKLLTRVNAWHSLYSDIATGFSTEATLGNTAYRGDLSIWLDSNIFKLFFRQTRTSPINTINIATRTINAGDWIYLEIEHHGNQTRYLVRVNNITIASGTTTTFNYPMMMHAVFGVRHGAVSVPVTNVSVDYFSYLSDTISEMISVLPGYNFNSMVETKYLDQEILRKQIKIGAFTYKPVPNNLIWSIKTNAS